MECRAQIVTTDPLTVHFSLLQPASAEEPLWVPRVLQPLGAFVSAELHDGAGAIVWKTERPKFQPKLAPSSPAAYVELDPGYSHGVILALEGAKIGAGQHSLTLTYQNLQYRGFAGHDLGEQTCTTTIKVP
jgi:hypothetical protein